LQQQYVAQQLGSNKQTKLISVAEDLINFHFLCAEALLAEDCQPDREIPTKKAMKQWQWKLNPAVKVQRFHFALEDLEMVGGESLEKIFKQLTPEPGYAIFLRQQGEVMIESLDDDFSRLLNRASEEVTTEQLLRGFDPHSAEELLDFAITQGLLLPVEPA
ncbi:MAG: hypothetical protein GQ563_06950, partial [Desulfuromusa sp.]|nr:hypothetical protein [Desulfuromusa sp.]